VLHYPDGDPEYYPMQITLRSGSPTEEIGESRYRQQNCHGKLTFSTTNQYGRMLTEKIQEPRGECSAVPLYFTVQVTPADKLEIKYWWSSKINASSHWYADATLERKG